MKLTGNLWKKLTIAWGSGSAPARPRRPRRVDLSWDCLEERKVLSHVGLHHHVHAHHAASSLTSSVAGTSTTASTANSAESSTAASTIASTAASTTSSTTGSTTSSGTSTSALSSALQTLHNDVQAIELASGTTVGQLAAIATSFAALKSDGLTPTSASALTTFENELVTNTAGATTSPTTTLNDFELLYTSTPSTLTATQTADLTTAYNALTSAVNSSNITAANISTINTDYAAVLAAQGSTSTATYPYFTLVTGHGGPGEGMEGGCH
jgi:hypothetical protein